LHQNDFALLDGIGGERAGAVSLLEPGQQADLLPPAQAVRWLSSFPRDASAYLCKTHQAPTFSSQPDGGLQRLHQEDFCQAQGEWVSNSGYSGPRQATFL
jgi:hypothetical protein